MPVTMTNPPPEADEVVQAALQQFAHVPEARLHALAGTRPAELAATAPHPVFTMGLSDLRPQRTRLGSTQSTGWRYLLRQDDQLVASAETLSDQDGGTRFSHFNQGPFVAGTAAAIETAEGLDETRDRSYEMRLLHVPALYTMALWLHDEGDDDILIPLAPAPQGVEPNRPYPAAELLDILAGKASQIPEMGPNDTRGG